MFIVGTLAGGDCAGRPGCAHNDVDMKGHDVPFHGDASKFPASSDARLNTHSTLYCLRVWWNGVWGGARPHARCNGYSEGPLQHLHT